MPNRQHDDAKQAARRISGNDGAGQLDLPAVRNNLQRIEGNTDLKAQVGRKHAHDNDCDDRGSEFAVF